MISTRSSISPKQRDFDWYLDAMEQQGLPFGYLKAYSTAGDIRPPRPYQWEAVAKSRPGDDDSYSGLGWTPIEAVRKLYRHWQQARRAAGGTP